MTKFGRWAELILLFIGVPLGLALFLPPTAMAVVLWGAGGLAVLILWWTPDFRWADLMGPLHWRSIIGLGVVTFGFALVLTLFLLPERVLGLMREAPEILLLLAMLYPVFLVLPQELIYRPLFYTRYGHLFQSETQALWINAALFSFGHLLYWHWVVFVMTFIGSILFTRAYRQDGSFPQALALHSIAGIAIFASGLGWLFYSGGNPSQ